MINAGTLQEADYNDQNDEEQFIRSDLGKGLSDDWLPCFNNRELGVEETSTYKILQEQE